MREEKGLVVVSELLDTTNDRVVRAMSGAIRNLAIDPQNKKLLGEASAAVSSQTDSGFLGMDWIGAGVCVEECLTFVRLCLLAGKHAIPYLVGDLPGGGQNQPVKSLKEETVVSILSTLHELLGSDLEAAKTLRTSQGIERLMLTIKDK